MERMKVAIHQPQYLPWLGYFDKVDQADCFVVLDTVQFKKNEWQNRNRIRTTRGWQWITVPVLHRFPQALNEVVIDNSIPWVRKHLHALIANYDGSAFFAVHRPFFEALYGQRWDRLSDLNLQALRYLLKAFEIETRLVLASDPDLAVEGTATARLVAICQALGADTYLSGAGGHNYLDLRQFDRAGIEVVFQDFRCPDYKQRFEGFVPNLSIVDLLFNCGGKDGIAMLRTARALTISPRL
jgi:hypothetical protein